MSEKPQTISCGCASNNRIVDVIQTSRNAPLRSSWSLEAPDPYSEIEFGYYAHLSSAKNLPEFEYKIEQSIKELGFQQFSYFRSDGGAGALMAQKRPAKNSESLFDDQLQASIGRCTAYC
ncbi:MAG: hypothetical protein P8Q91_07900 [Porticoccaceae bacterium]|jgi:hypothetical protein|nr:hypothetical protein [Porticoccaceae bacterium]